jgi:hypothetical protein
MLADVTFITLTDPYWLSVGQPFTRVSTGVWLDTTLNLNNFVDPRQQIVNEYPNLPCAEDEWRSPYGVADNIQQVLDKYKDVIEDPDRYYLIFFTEMRKEDQEAEGGWRWHKWGEYIGVQKPQCEYLYDEPVITSVYVFHIMQVQKPWEPADCEEPVADNTQYHEELNR